MRKSRMITDGVFRRVLLNCRIRLGKEEYKEMKAELDKILEAFRVLDKIDTKNAKPAYHPIPIQDVLRGDKAERFNNVKGIVSLARKNKEGYIWGPKTM